MKLYSLLSLLFVLGFFSAHANNLQVSNVSFEGTPGDDFYDIYFDISWENSWRTSTFESNYDAAWVFVKYRNPNDGNEWRPALVGQVSIPTGTVINVPNDQLGFFIQRSADGIGDVSYSIAPFVWQLDDPFDPSDEIEICVYAIEMVYIPEGPFQVGDGSVGSLEDLGRGFKTGGFSFPYTIYSEDQITLGGSGLTNLTSHATAGGLSGYFSDDFDNTTTQILPASFPKGFSAFYSMKYEISQGQYAAFLNSIPSVSAEDRFADEYGISGQTIKLVGYPNYYEADSPERAMNYMNYIDLAHYADWSGLRPMSELEYEKLCRGPRSAVPGEYAWGDATIWADAYVIANEGTAEEYVVNPSSNVGNALTYISDVDNRPNRCGIFSSSGSVVGRKQSGAGYYGVYDLTGNVNELVISIGSYYGRAFLASDHGDGEYSNSTPFSWPVPFDNVGGNAGLGSGYRSGEVNDLDFFRVSYRYVVNSSFVARSSFRGGRLVRSSF